MIAVTTKISIRVTPGRLAEVCFIEEPFIVNHLISSARSNQSRFLVARYRNNKAMHSDPTPKAMNQEPA